MQGKNAPPCRDCSPMACLVAYAVAARKIFQIFARQPFSARPSPHAALILSTS